MAEKGATTISSSTGRPYLRWPNPAAPSFAWAYTHRRVRLRRAGGDGDGQRAERGGGWQGKGGHGGKQCRSKREGGVSQLIREPAAPLAGEKSRPSLSPTSRPLNSRTNPVHAGHDTHTHTHTQVTIQRSTRSQPSISLSSTSGLLNSHSNAVRARSRSSRSRLAYLGGGAHRRPPAAVPDEGDDARGHPRGPEQRWALLHVLHHHECGPRVQRKKVLCR